MTITSKLYYIHGNVHIIIFNIKSSITSDKNKNMLKFKNFKKNFKLIWSRNSIFLINKFGH